MRSPHANARAQDEGPSRGPSSFQSPALATELPARVAVWAARVAGSPLTADVWLSDFQSERSITDPSTDPSHQSLRLTRCCGARCYAPAPDSTSGAPRNRCAEART